MMPIKNKTKQNQHLQTTPYYLQNDTLIDSDDFSFNSDSDSESIKNAYGDLNSPIHYSRRKLSKPANVLNTNQMQSYQTQPSHQSQIYQHQQVHRSQPSHHTHSSHQSHSSRHNQPNYGIEDSYSFNQDHNYRHSQNLSFISKDVNDNDFIMDDFDNQSDLDNILIDDEYKNIPMLENKFENYAFSESNEPLINDGGEIMYNKKNIKKYYLLELAGAYVFGALITNNIIFLSQFEISDFTRYIAAIIFNNMSLLAILYATTNVSTYRSINITLVYLILNAGIFNYNIKTILAYLFIDMTGSFLGSITMAGIYHDYLRKAPIRNLLLCISPQTQDPYTGTEDYLVISGIVFIIFILINVVVISYDTSINCKSTVLKKVAISFFMNLLFMHHTSGVNNTWVSYGFKFSYSMFLQNVEIFRTPRFVAVVINLFAWLIVSPLIVKYFNGKFKTWYARYIEYN